MPERGHGGTRTFQDLREALRLLRICNRIAPFRCNEHIHLFVIRAAEGTKGTMGLNRTAVARSFGWVRRMLEAIFVPLE